MARPIRVEFEGAVYHVMARGNERQAIFRSTQDRVLFLDTLGETVTQFGLVVHVYCLMPNHYHLVVETPRGNLSRAIGWLQGTYTVRFNRRYRRSGHLFQGRFKAQLVDGEEYGRELVRYVHLNPVRPRRKSDPIPRERAAELDGYRWSSHRAYAGLAGKAEWLCLDWLAMWGKRRGAAQRVYRRAMREAFDKPVSSPWEELRGGLVLGTDALWEKARGLVKAKGAAGAGGGEGAGGEGIGCGSTDLGASEIGRGTEGGSGAGVWISAPERRDARGETGGGEGAGRREISNFKS